MATPEVVSTRGMKNQVRIRGPKPDVSFPTKSLDELESLLKKHIDTCKDKPVPETVYAQFLFDNQVVFQIKDTSDGIRDHFPHLQDAQNNTGPSSLPVTEAVAQVSDTKLKLRRQRAVGRAILRSIQAVDDFNYFEKEAWDTKHADGYRFKYLCKDSYQNKDRAANKSRKSTDPSSFQSINGAGSASGTPSAQPPPTACAPDASASGDQSPTKGDVSEWFKKHGITPPAAESPSRLPTYDCKGSIFVKFSSSQGVVDVVYQHLPIHNSTNERAPDPIPERHSRASLPAMANNGTPHDDSGDPMDTSEMASYATPQAATPVAAPVPDATKAAGKKRKRASTKPARESIIEAETSDLEALDDEWDLENQEPPLPLVDPNFEPDPGDGDLWRPSVVTLVPGLKAQMKQAVKKSFASSTAASRAHQATAAADIDDSSASGSDFSGGGGTAKKAAQKKKGGPGKGKATASKSSAGAAATNGEKGGGGATSSRDIGTGDKDVQSSDRPTRKRTKTGCLTCRGRKLKCDEARPTCTQCKRSRPPRECSFPDDDDLSDSLMT